MEFTRTDSWLYFRFEMLGGEKLSVASVSAHPTGLDSCSLAAWEMRVACGAGGAENGGIGLREKPLPPWL